MIMRTYSAAALGLILALGPALVLGQTPDYGLLREVWEGIPSEGLSMLTDSPDYPDRPTSTNYVTDLFESPTDVLDNYGQRMHGYVVAPQTGNYTFWIASDDNGALYLSTDENPANARVIATVNSWTSARAWDWEANQMSEPVALVGGRIYYIAALMKEGGGGDNLAVRWLLPDGTDQAPMIATNLLPYGISFAAPVIAEHPAPTTAIEGGAARFSVKTASFGVYSYQWLRNSMALSGATAAELVYGPVALADQGARFRCVVSNKLGTATSNEGILTVSPDTTPPALVLARNLGLTQVEVTFSERVSAPSATTATHYRIDGLNVGSAAFGPSPNLIYLTTSSMILGAAYTLTVNHVQDAAATPNAVSPNASIQFVATDFTTQDVGNPPLSGDVEYTSGGVEVRGSGDIGGTADALQFAWQKRTGAFDMRARVARFDSTDPFAKAGLMVREELSAGSRFAAALCTPATVGCVFMARSVSGAAASRSGYCPANYPETWLRLKRSANLFTAYAGHDGQSWVELGSAQLALPETVYFGLASASRNTAALATASFRDIGAVSGAASITWTPRGERLGSSSRQTPLVFSEIMYRPPQRPDGRTGEFIELYNADLIAADLTGHRLGGSIQFAFPDGFVLAAGGFAVIARNPVEFAAVYGIADALGPFVGGDGLPNDGGTVRIENPEGATLLEVNYESGFPWPVAAGGGGHSLVLARPSYGEDDPRAWAASDLIGGSPKQMDAVRANPLADVLINEFLARPEDAQRGFIELYNHGNSGADVGGCILTDDAEAPRFRIADGTVIPPRGFLAFYEEQIGFGLDGAGGRLFLVNSNSTRVLDAVRYGAQERGTAVGRFPDGAPGVGRLSEPSPDNENRPQAIDAVAINEIMYNPISGDDADEFIELHNRGGQPVELGGWRFTDGVDFQFPAGTIIEGGGYLVVAKSRPRLLASHPGLDPALVFGDYGEALANGGERLALAKPDLLVLTNAFGLPETNRILIDVDEVRYGVGGRWGQWSDGLGSSLELIDAHSDHAGASNWADSDESAKAAWATLEWTGVLDNGDGGSASHLHIMMQGPGECLVDNVEVVPSTGGNRITNPGFESGLTGWVIQGNHRRSEVRASGGINNSRCLHVRATGRGDTACNRIYIPISPALTQNATATLRARVRWLKGWPEFMLRTRGSYLEAAGRMALPSDLGTPGARNSRWVANAGPSIVEVVHTPVLPAANQAVVVSARLSDPDGLGTVRVRYRIDPGGTTTDLVMKDDGTAGDAVAGDGVYSARLSGRTLGTLVAFYVEAADNAQASSTARFPADAPERECLVRWGETQPVGNLGVYRLWQRRADYDWLRSREPLANDNVDCTFVYDDGRVVYNVEMRGKGSPWHGGSVGSDYIFTFPGDDRFLGARDVALVTVGNLGSDDSAQREQAAFWIGRHMGTPTLHRRHVLFFENGARKQTVYEDTEEPNGRYVDRWWPAGEDGDLYKVEDWFEFNDTGDSFTFSRDATLEKFTTTGGAYKLARYRWAWRKRAVADSANNYTNLFNLVTAVNLTGSALVPQVENQVDVENWMRVFALQHIVGNWDAYGYNRGKNCYIYKPVNGRFGMIPWDIDMVLGSGSDGPTTDIFGANDPIVTRLWNTPAFRRVYLRAYWDAVAGPLQNARFDPIVDGRHSALRANGVTVADPRPIKSWVAQRRAYLANRVAGMDVKDFAITSNGGNDWTTGQLQVTLSGTAPIAIKTIELNGAVMPVTWTSATSWSALVALGGRTNVLTLVGYDSRGAPVAGASDAVRIIYTGTELPAAADQVVINEIMYHPLAPDAAFIELYNASATAPFDLSGWRLGGVGFTFPSGVVLGAGGFAVVASNRDGFAAAYGFNVLPVGEFPGNLQNDGERLRLVRPGATPEDDELVDEVRYANEPPWPVQADGWGPSLQLIDPRQDNWCVGNWAAAHPGDAVVATPGKPNSVVKTLPPFPPLLINEVQPQNVSGPVDRFGDRDPWIELHNPGTNGIDLSGFFLTSTYTNLTEWAFPVGARIGPGAFLLVWADGEPVESTEDELHTRFRLEPGSGAVALVREQLGAPAVIDYINYQSIPDDLSTGSYPDGQPQARQLFHLPTPGRANDPGTPPVEVLINEWMASNTGVVLDPADGDPDDWFELYNAGARSVDVSAYTLTDDLAAPAKFVIPNGTVIPAGGFLLAWADEDVEQSGQGQLHVNFRLSATGESIGLFTPDGRAVDTIAFGSQTNNISEGRFPDGMIPPPFVFMGRPTPGGPNEFPTLNVPPTLDPVGSRIVDEGQTAAFTASATDPDAGQTLVFALFGAPPGARIDAGTGAFSWTTTEADGPGEYAFTVRVTDDGTPARWDAEQITVTVREVNQSPTLDPIADQSVDEGSALSIQAVARDVDQPAQSLRFSLAGVFPEGATINEATGEFSWTPAEDQGARTHVVTVQVVDDSVPPGSATRSFQVVVNEVDNTPVFEPVSLRTVDELSPFALRVIARDPDSPARAVSYRLESGPPGLTLDPGTGQVIWTPVEAQGPNSYNVVIRATEIGGTQASTLSFAIVVNEVNEPPTLAAIADRTLAEGTVFSFINSAADTDLPRQTLRFSLDPDAPPGASIDPQSGLFLWAIGEDAGPSTNRITVRVADDALDARSAARTFTVVVVAQVRVVINEIMYRPPPDGAEFVEIHNTSTNTSWRLDGWRLIGAAFTFPAGTVLAPGGFLAVARDAGAFQAAYGSKAPVIGNYLNQLSPGGGTIRLVRPVAGGLEETVDQVSFLTRAPWPASANGAGPSLQLIDPRQDNARVGNWSAVSGTSTNAPVSVVPMTASWRYWQDASAPAPGWTNQVYDDSPWPNGGALLYVENEALPASKTTPLTIGQMSYLFRTRFQFNGSPDGASLQLRTIIDDGLVLYLNGRAFFWLGMEEGVLPARPDPANRTIGNATEEGPFVRLVDNLRMGENVLAAEVHQNSVGSTDIAFGVAVDVIEVRRESATPGYANSVRATLEPFPEVRINEVLADNQTGITDSRGDRDPWVEIVNRESGPSGLEGFFLANSYGNLGQWGFPKGAVLAGGQYQLVWADGEPGEASAGEWHTGFRLTPPAGVVVLSRLQNGQLAVVDFLEYAGLTADRSYGYMEPRFDAGAPAVLAQPSPGQPNLVNEPPRPRILSIAAGGSGEVTLVWETAPGWTYRIEGRASVESGWWELLGQVVGTSATATFTDFPPDDLDACYYRVLVVP